MRLAVLADIHGNLPALEAVCVELERLQPDQVVVDGDLINAVPFSREVIDLVRSRPWTVVRGNHEFYYLDYGTARAVAGTDEPDRWGQLHWLVAQMTPAHGAYLAMLPDDCTFYIPGTQPLRVAHGVPGRNRVGFYRAQPDAAIAAELDGVAERTLITAHTHVQIDRQVTVMQDGGLLDPADPHGVADHHGQPMAPYRRWHVVNPGSVGLPLDGRTVAQFALLESVPEHVAWGGWQVTHYAVTYDLRRALEAYYTSGMLEAGGVYSLLFYWELVTAEPEIIRFYRWAMTNGHDPDRGPIRRIFEQYTGATGRDQYVRDRDPLHQLA